MVPAWSVGLVGIFSGSVLIAMSLTRFVRDVATRRSWVSGPSSERHIHVRAVPRIGGIAIYTTFVTVLTAIWLFGKLYPGFDVAPVQSLFRILGPASLLFFVGLVDDRKGLRASFKLLVQALAAVWLFAIGNGVRLTVPHTNHTVGWSVSLVLTIIWVILVSNAFNLIDGLDGLAAGAALFPLTTIIVFGAVHHNVASLVGATLMAACLLGFLRYNFNPATIFLGDSGSLFIGFMLSALSLGGYQAKLPTLASISFPVIAFALPLAETFFSVLRRSISGIPIFTPDKEHFHHRLLDRGFSHRRAVVLLYGCSGLCAILSLLLLHPTALGYGLVAAMLAAFLLLGIPQLRYLEFSEMKRAAKRTLKQNQVVANNIRIRRASLRLTAARDSAEIGDCLSTLFYQLGFDDYSLFIHGISNANDEPLSVAEERKWLWFFELTAGMAELRLTRFYSSGKPLFDIDVIPTELIPALEEALLRVYGDVRISSVSHT